MGDLRNDDGLAEWLTAVLWASGSLTSGRVLAVASDATGAFNSAAAHLRLTYSEDAPESAPRAVFLKRSLPAPWAVRAGVAEVAFYRQIAALPDAAARLPMIVPCFAAGYDPERETSYVLLQDVSQTHHAPLTRDQILTAGQNIPRPRDLDRVVTTLARFHAFWWEHPMLALDPGETGIAAVERADFDAMMARRSAAWERVLAREGDTLPAEMCRLVERVLAGLPTLWECHWGPRSSERRQVTVTHGDAYFANFLVPRDPESDAPTYLIDWQSPETNVGAEDLVNMLATFWTSPQRREGGREERVLRRYHETLLAHGVSGYTWDELLRDYRLALIDWLLVPVQDAGDGSRRNYWWPKLKCLAAAYEDWRCDELLAQ